MKVIEKADEIILRDIPFKKWISEIFLLLIFGIGGVTIFYDVIKYPNATFELQSSWYNIAFNVLWFAFIAAIIIGVVYVAIKDLLVPQITTRIKPSAQTVDVISRKFFFFKRIERFYFSQIKSFDVIYPKPDEDLCFNVLTLVNGAQIDLESTGNKKNSTVEIRKKLNTLLKKDKIKPVKNKSKRNKASKNKGKDES